MSGSPKIGIRLPKDHWIWEVSAGKRSEIIKRALDTYKEEGRVNELISELQKNKEEIRCMINEAKVEILKALTTDQFKLPEIKENTNKTHQKLLEGMDKFIEF